jgi:endonuclease/exonuclease/phosphatase family metal-dependent hydrolase
MNRITGITFISVAALLGCTLVANAQQSAQKLAGQRASPQSSAFEQTGPPVLSYEEIVRLYNEDSPSAPLRDKLSRLLTTPFVSNRATASGVRPLKPSSDQLGTFLRVAQWNIERGLEFEAVRAAFSDPQQLSALMEEKQSTASPAERAQIADQVNTLRQSDLIVLNEVDWGMNRTLFRNVAQELAEALGMNYAYGVEFVEVDPITMGLDQQIVVREVEDAYAVPDESKAQMIAQVRKIMKPDPERYRGLHGTAILSRYPLSNVRLIPFSFQGHDWYADEKKNVSQLAKDEGKVSVKVFKEQLVRQVRRGGRMMLLADITDPQLPTGKVTIVATHLEDMAPPAARRKQLAELLDRVQRIDNPVIVAGDMNTSEHDATPLSVTRALKQRFGSAKWWAEEGATEGIKRATPFGWAYDASVGLIGFVRNVDDPTVRSIPLVGKNPEAKFFQDLERFKFADGGSFDFRGLAERTSNGRSGNLADSNERGEKGFIPTSEFGKTYGPVGRYKLDWIFVKPGKLVDPSDARQPYLFAPNFGRTLKELDYSIPDRISDHSPITVDLPLAEPPLTARTPASDSKIK